MEMRLVFTVDMGHTLIALFLNQQKKYLESAINKKVIGFRAHYLKFDCEKTWHILSKNGFKYDSTLGFHDHAGFRSGMAHLINHFALKMISTLI